MWLVRFARDSNKKINIEIVYLNQRPPALSPLKRHMIDTNVYKMQKHEQKYWIAGDALMRCYCYIHTKCIRCLISIDVLSGEKRKDFFNGQCEKRAIDLCTVYS